MHDTVHDSLLAAGAGSFQRTGRVVHPDIHALNEQFGYGNVIIRDEYNLADELRHLRDLDDAFNEVLTCTVGRVSLTCEQELDGMFRVVDYLVQTVEVAEQQGRTFVCCETACETDGKYIVPEGLLDLDNLLG